MTRPQAVQQAMEEHGKGKWLTTSQIAAAMERLGNLPPEEAVRVFETVQKHNPGHKNMPEQLSRRIILGYRSICTRTLSRAASESCPRYSLPGELESKPHPDAGDKRLWRLKEDRS